MAERAPRSYEISIGPDAGSDEENWLRAEEELRHAHADHGGQEETYSSVPSEGNTKQELYEQAKKLGIEGWSKMSKSELAEAIARRR